MVLRVFFQELGSLPFLSSFSSEYEIEKMRPLQPRVLESALYAVLLFLELLKVLLAINSLALFTDL